MARINVDDEWYADPLERRAVLIKKMAGLPLDPCWMADGAALAAWRLAQKFWKDDEQLIPSDLWARSGLEPLVEAGLAEHRTEGVYVKGTSERQDWLLRRCAAGKRGGKNSAAARKEKNGTAQPLSKTPKQTRSTGAAQLRDSRSKSEASPKQPRSLSSTHMLREDFSETPSALGRAVDKSLVLDAALLMATTQHEDKPTGVKVWEAYRTAYRNRYSVDPVRNSKVNSNCLALVKRLGLESAVQVVGFYLRHNDQNYTRKSHALGLCLYDAEALNTQMLTGKTVTATQARQTDETQSNINAAQGAMDILMGRKGSVLVTRE